MSFATDLIRQVLRVAEAHGAVGVDEVGITIGEMQLIVPEALSTAFEIVARDTVAEGATLTIREEPLEACCRACGRRFAAAIDNYQCPDCGGADVEIVAGRDVVLDSVVCRTPERAQPS